MESILIPVIVQIVIGIVLLFFGLRFMKFVVSLFGFIIGYSVVSAATVSGGWPVWLGVLAAILIGLLLAGIAYRFYRLAIVVSVAYLLGTILYAALLSLQLPEAVAGIIAIVAGILAIALLYKVKFVEVLFAVSTSIQGAGLVVAGIYALVTPGIFVHDPSVTTVLLAASGWWLLIWAIVAALGLTTQLAGFASTQSKLPADTETK